MENKLLKEADQLHNHIANELRLGGSMWASGIHKLKQIGYRPTAASLHAARILLENYEMSSKRAGFDPSPERIAILIDVCSSMHAVPQPLIEATRLLHEIQEEVRAVNPYGLLLNHEISRVQEAALCKRAKRIFQVLVNLANIHNRLPRYKEPLPVIQRGA